MTALCPSSGRWRADQGLGTGDDPANDDACTVVSDNPYGVIQDYGANSQWRTLAKRG